MSPHRTRVGQHKWVLGTNCSVVASLLLWLLSLSSSLLLILSCWLEGGREAPRRSTSARSLFSVPAVSSDHLRGSWSSACGRRGPVGAASRGVEGASVRCARRTGGCWPPKERWRSSPLIIGCLE